MAQTCATGPSHCEVYILLGISPNPHLDGPCHSPPHSAYVPGSLSSLFPDQAMFFHGFAHVVPSAQNTLVFFLTMPGSAFCITCRCNYLLTCPLSSRAETNALFTVVSPVPGTEQFLTTLIEPMIEWTAIALRFSNHFGMSLCGPSNSSPTPGVPVKRGKGLKALRGKFRLDSWGPRQTLQNLRKQKRTWCWTADPEAPTLPVGRTREACKDFPK